MASLNQLARDLGRPRIMGGTKHQLEEHLHPAQCPLVIAPYIKVPLSRLRERGRGRGSDWSQHRCYSMGMGLTRVFCMQMLPPIGVLQSVHG